MAKTPKAITDMSTLARVIFDPDTVPPSVPTGVAGVATSSTRIDLSWSASTDTGGSGLTGYLVYRGSGQIAQVGATSLSYSDTGLLPSTPYQYQVAALDGAGNLSGKSTVISVTTQAAPTGPPVVSWSYPIASLLGIAGVQDYPSTAWSTYAKHNTMFMGGYWEGHTSLNRQAAVTGIKAASTLPTKTLVFQYMSLNQIDTSANGVAYSLWRSEVQTRNWLCYLVRTTGSPLPSLDGPPTQEVLYTDYAGTNPSLEYPYEFGAKYCYNAVLTTTREVRFTSLSTNLVATNLDGLLQDNFLCDPGLDGDFNRDGVTETHGSPTVITPWLQAGQLRYCNQMRALAPTKYVMANYGGGYGDAGTASAGVMQSQLDGGVCESFIGKDWSRDTWQGFVPMMAAYYKALDIAKNPQMVVFQGSWPDTASDGSALIRRGSPGHPSDGFPPVYTLPQYSRYIAGCAYIGGGQSAINKFSTGYSSNLADIVWPEEYDQAGAAALGWLGNPLTGTNGARPTGPRFKGMWVREFDNGAIVVSPSGNTTQTFTSTDLPGNFKTFAGTGVNNNTAFTSITMGERDARFLVRVISSGVLKTYQTFFPATQNPIVEDGGWVRGKSEGLNWTDPQTTAGWTWPTMNAFDGSHFIDSVAHRTGHQPDHYVRVVVHNAGAPSGLEVEILLRFQITAGTARGYELDWVNSSNELNVVRWNGPGGTAGGGAGVAYDIMGTYTTGVSLQDGDVLEGYVIGSVITAYCTPLATGIRALIATINVQQWATQHGGNYWSTGQPGFGGWNETGASNSKLGIKYFFASDYVANPTTLPLADPTVPLFTLIGSFKLPSAFQFGGSAMSATNGIMYISGLTQSQASLGSFQVPTRAQIIAGGATATTIQAPVSIPGDIGQSSGGNSTFTYAVGSLAYNGSLYINLAEFYNAASHQTGWLVKANTGLTTFGVPQGMTLDVEPGAPLSDFTGPLGLVPAAWQPVIGGPAYVTGGLGLGITSTLCVGFGLATFDPATASTSANNVPLRQWLNYKYSNIQGTFGDNGLWTRPNILGQISGTTLTVSQITLQGLVITRGATAKWAGGSTSISALGTGAGGVGTYTLAGSFTAAANTPIWISNTAVAPQSGASTGGDDLASTYDGPLGNVFFPSGTRSWVFVNVHHYGPEAPAGASNCDTSASSSNDPRRVQLTYYDGAAIVANRNAGNAISKLAPYAIANFPNWQSLFGACPGVISPGSENGWICIDPVTNIAYGNPNGMGGSNLTIYAWDIGTG